MKLVEPGDDLRGVATLMQLDQFRGKCMYLAMQQVDLPEARLQLIAELVEPGSESALVRAQRREVAASAA